MNYIVYVTLRNAFYQYSVPSIVVAQAHVDNITKHEYRYFEGNLCISYKPDQIRDAIFQKVSDT
jgi:hypothetical protein